MPVKKTLFWTVLIFSFGVGVATLYTHLLDTDSATATPEPPASDLNNQRMDQLESSVNILGNELSRIRNNMEDEEENRGRVVTSEETSENDSGKEPVEPRNSNLDPAEIISNKHEQEIPDRSWASKTEADIEERMTDNFPNLDLLSADCRSTMCRLVISSPEQGFLEEFSMESTNVPALDGPMMGSAPETNDDGQLETTIYLMREGHQFPE